MALKLFTTINFREIVGTEKQSSEKGLRIESPRIVQFHPNADGTTVSIGLHPYSMTNPDGIHEFYYSAIISECEVVPEDIEKGYYQQTSGISIVSSIK